MVLSFKLSKKFNLIPNYGIRPILMTALTTILGLSTMALGIGSGTEMIQPLGIVTIGGLIYATLLTLFVIPCLYMMFNRDEKKSKKKAN